MTRIPSVVQRIGMQDLPNPVHPQEDDSQERVTLMIRHRLPWIIVGLLGGIIATVFASQFEALFAKNIQLAFFIPVIVYMADAVGTQTETVYVRNLGRKNVRLGTYLLKEILLGLAMGAIFGAIMATFSYLWFRNLDTSMTVGLAMFTTMAVAPAISLIIPSIIQREHRDPAVIAGPFTTIIQDIISLAFYFVIATLIIFR